MPPSMAATSELKAPTWREMRVALMSDRRPPNAPRPRGRARLREGAVGREGGAGDVGGTPVVAEEEDRARHLPRLGDGAERDGAVYRLPRGGGRRELSRPSGLRVARLIALRPSVHFGSSGPSRSP